MKYSQLLITLLLSANIPLALAAEQRQHGAHEHGFGKLDIALEGKELHIALDSPAANIVGFEHTTRNETDHEIVEKALTLLKAGSTLFTFPKSSECRLINSDIDSALDNHEEHVASNHEEHEASHGEKHQKDNDHKETHTDIRATWHFDCANLATLDRISVRIFELFPNTEHLQVQFITETKQSATKLTASQSELPAPIASIKSVSPYIGNPAFNTNTTSLASALTIFP